MIDQVMFYHVGTESIVVGVWTGIQQRNERGIFYEVRWSDGKRFESTFRSMVSAKNIMEFKKV